MRVVGITDDDILLFSDLIDSTAENIADEDGIIQVKLSPGIRLKGDLDHSVPRPIKNGFVDLCIAEATGHGIPSPQGDQSYGHPKGFIWREIVPVNEDGTFEVQSLPPGGHLQLFALTDGFQSRLSTVDEIMSLSRKQARQAAEEACGGRQATAFCHSFIHYWTTTTTEL